MPTSALCNIMMMPVRAEAAHRAEMVNMLLFGERYEIQESQDNWHRISSALDGYEGWLYSRKLFILEPEEAKLIENEKPVYSAEPIWHSPDMQLALTLGSRLPAYADGNFNIGIDKYSFHGKVKEGNTTDHATILETAMHYLQAPYLWGGRSPMGIDCSGLTQMVYLLNGIKLPRDAWQQAQKGMEIDGLENAQAGDLIFFAEKTRISHVGIYTGNGELIHASKTVVREKIDEKGIFNSEIEEYTLQAIAVRRYI